MNKKYEIILNLVSILFLVIASVTFGYVTRSQISSIIIDIKNPGITAPEQCENLTMVDTAYCLNKYVKSIFKYKPRDDLENPTLEELKEEGGDCLNWAELYVKYIKQLGFNAERPLIDTDNKTLHTFAVISDNTGYCILDQRMIECQKLGNSLSLKNETQSI